MTDPPSSAAAHVPGHEDPGSARPAPTAPGRRSLLPVVAVAGVAGVVGGLGGGVLADQLTPPGPQGGGTLEPASVTTAPRVPTPDGTISGLSRTVLPSVALISIGEDSAVGLGSGFVVREDGYLVTNHHVIQAADEEGISVELPGQDPMQAQVVGSDVAYDIAVLKVDQTGLAALPFADSDSVQVGQTVVAVGAPLGLDSTITSGIVSALDRPVVAGETQQSTSYISAVQTDAAINPGNSGGPLLDLGGRVVGVNSAIAQLPSGSFGGPSGSIGLGFAIPAEQVERTATQLIETGTSSHPVIGVLVDLGYTGEGAKVLTDADAQTGDPVIDGGPADLAGIRPGDLIVEVDGATIRDAQHLLVVLRSYAVGDTVDVVLRDEAGQERTVSITLVSSQD